MLTDFPESTSPVSALTIRMLMSTSFLFTWNDPVIIMLALIILPIFSALFSSTSPVMDSSCSFITCASCERSTTFTEETEHSACVRDSAIPSPIQSYFVSFVIFLNWNTAILISSEDEAAGRIASRVSNMAGTIFFINPPAELAINHCA